MINFFCWDGSSHDCVVVEITRLIDFLVWKREIADNKMICKIGPLKSSLWFLLILTKSHREFLIDYSIDLCPQGLKSTSLIGPGRWGFDYDCYLIRIKLKNGIFDKYF